MMKRTILMILLTLHTLLCFSQVGKATETLKRDTLVAKRTFIWTKVYKNSQLVEKGYLKDMMNLDTQAKIKYTWGKTLQPIAPIAIIGGIALMANGLTGVERSIDIDGVTYNYQDRSLKKTLLGLASTALGICLIESSNELIQHSVTIYNDAVMNRKAKVSYKVGVTPEGNVGLVMKF